MITANGSSMTDIAGEEYFVVKDHSGKESGSHVRHKVKSVETYCLSQTQKISETLIFGGILIA